MKDANKNEVKVGDHIWDWINNRGAEVLDIDEEHELFETANGRVHKDSAQLMIREDEQQEP